MLVKHLRTKFQNQHDLFRVTWNFYKRTLRVCSLPQVQEMRYENLLLNYPLSVVVAQITLATSC